MAYWRRSGHIPVMIVLQIIFIILFAVFVVYNPENALYGKGTYDRAHSMMEDYPREWIRMILLERFVANKAKSTPSTHPSSLGIILRATEGRVQRLKGNQWLQEGAQNFAHFIGMWRYRFFFFFFCILPRSAMFLTILTARDGEEWSRF